MTSADLIRPTPNHPGHITPSSPLNCNPSHTDNAHFSFPHSLISEDASRELPTGILFDEPPSLLQQSQSLLVNMKQQSQALRNLTEMSDKLLGLMTQVAHAIDVLVPDQPPPKRHTPVPSNLRLTTINSTIHSTTTRAPNIQSQRVPSTWHPETPYLRTLNPPWPHHPTVPFPKPAPNLKPQQTCMKRIPEKPSVVCSCQGMRRTKDNLRPP